MYFGTENTIKACCHWAECFLLLQFDHLVAHLIRNHLKANLQLERHVCMLLDECVTHSDTQIGKHIDHFLVYLVDFFVV